MLHHMADKTPWCFNPVADLPGDMAAICLSFVGIPSLMLAAQRVCRAWRDAIHGGLPGIWSDICVEFFRNDCDSSRLLDVMENRIQPFISRCLISAHNLLRFPPFCNLRVLEVMWLEGTIGAVLSGLPLLEAFSVTMSFGLLVSFPPLPFLATVQCSRCKSIQGLHNLPALTKLDLDECTVEVDIAWPASLRELAIFAYSAIDYRVVHRIAELQQPVELRTDWSFLHKNCSEQTFLIPPYDQLAFLSRFNTLQRFALTIKQGYSPPPQILFQYQYCDAMIHLQELAIEVVEVTDEDLHCLAILSNLRSLHFYCVNTLSALCFHHISAIPNLTSLHLQDCSGITDYSLVGSCRHLIHLFIHYHLHCLSYEEVQSISQLQHLHELDVLVWSLVEPESFARFCAMHTLREFRFCCWDSPVPPAAFASLPSLRLLERIHLPQDVVSDFTKLVDCLVQMPTLRHVIFDFLPNKQDQARLRHALPRLETLLCSSHCFRL